MRLTLCISYCDYIHHSLNPQPVIKHCSYLLSRYASTCARSTSSSEADALSVPLRLLGVVAWFWFDSGSDWSGVPLEPRPDMPELDWEPIDRAPSGETPHTNDEVYRCLQRHYRQTVYDLTEFRTTSKL